jgi:hypothetical protein
MPAFSQGCAPLLSQLPTDQLGPAEQHREVPIGAADQSLASFSLENLQETIGFDQQISWDFLYMFIQVLGILLHPKLDYFSVNSCNIPARLGTGGWAALFLAGSKGLNRSGRCCICHLCHERYRWGMLG